jgi:hypothetical protein
MKKLSIAVLRFIIGGILLVAALGKLLTPGQSYESFAALAPAFYTGLGKVMFFLLILIECIIGIMLVVYGHGRNLSSTLVVVVVLSFSFLGFSAGRVFAGDQGPCGCFGSIEAFSDRVANPLLILLALSSVLGALLQFNPTRKAWALVFASAALLFGNVSYYVLNNVSEYALMAQRADDAETLDWFGLPTTSVSGLSPEDVMRELFGKNYDLWWPHPGSPAAAVVAPPQVRDRHQGWLVMLAVPAPRSGTGLLRLGLVYDTSLSLRQIRIQLPTSDDKLDREHDQARLQFLGSLIMKGGDGPAFFRYGEAPILLEEDPALGLVIVDVVNMTTHRLLTMPDYFMASREEQ